MLRSKNMVGFWFGWSPPAKEVVGFWQTSIYSVANGLGRVKFESGRVGLFYFSPCSILQL